MPLLLSFKNYNKRDWTRNNIEFLCYNCYFLNVGDIFTAKQIQGIEDYKDTPKTQEVKWEMDDNTYEHFKSLGLTDELNDDDFISYNK